MIPLCTVSSKQFPRQYRLNFRNNLNRTSKTTEMELNCLKSFSTFGTSFTICSILIQVIQAIFEANQIKSFIPSAFSKFPKKKKKKKYPRFIEAGNRPRWFPNPREFANLISLIDCKELGGRCWRMERKSTNTA